MKTNSRRHRKLTSSLFYLCGIVALTACSNNYNDIRNSQSDNLTASRKSSEDKNEDEGEKKNEQNTESNNENVQHEDNNIPVNEENNTSYTPSINKLIINNKKYDPKSLQDLFLNYYKTQKNILKGLNSSPSSKKNKPQMRSFIVSENKVWINDKEYPLNSFKDFLDIVLKLKTYNIRGQEFHFTFKEKSVSFCGSDFFEIPAGDRINFVKLINTLLYHHAIIKGVELFFGGNMLRIGSIDFTDLARKSLRFWEFMNFCWKILGRDETFTIKPYSPVINIKKKSITYKNVVWINEIGKTNIPWIYIYDQKEIQKGRLILKKELAHIFILEGQQKITNNIC